MKQIKRSPTQITKSQQTPREKIAHPTALSPSNYEDSKPTVYQERWLRVHHALSWAEAKIVAEALHMDGPL